MEQDTHGNASSSGTMDLATIPRASSISSFLTLEIDKAFTVKISRASSNFTHELRLYVGSKHIGTWSGIGTSRTITLTTSQQNEIYKTIPNAVHSQVTMYCYTYSGNTLIGSRTFQTATASVPSSIRPSIGSIHLKDLKDINVPVHIQGLSNFQIGVRDAVGAKYSTIATYEYRFGGESKRSIQSVLETGIVNRSGNYTIEVIVTDTRGRTGSKAVTVYIEPYGNPVVRNMTVERTNANGDQDPLGTYIRVVSNGEYFKVNNENWATISINARAIGDEVWNSIHYELVDSGGTFNIDEVIAGFPITKSYEVNININDRFGRRTNAYRVLPSGEVVMSWGKDGVGIGKIHEGNATLEVGGDVRGDGFSIQNSDGTFTTIKKDGNIAIGIGSPSTSDTGGSNIQLYHDGRIKAQGDLDVNGNVYVNGVKNAHVVATGVGSGVVINMRLENSSIYLFAVGRDQGLYLISTFQNEIIVSTILDMTGQKSITGNGLNLKVDFYTRNRFYALYKMR